MKLIKFKINNCIDRERMIIALANSGYKVEIKEERGKHSWEKDYFVIVYLEEK